VGHLHRIRNQLPALTALAGFVGYVFPWVIEAPNLTARTVAGNFQFSAPEGSNSCHSLLAPAAPDTLKRKIAMEAKAPTVPDIVGNWKAGMLPATTCPLKLFNRDSVDFHFDPRWKGCGLDSCTSRRNISKILPVGFINLLKIPEISHIDSSLHNLIQG
jgi:hypothetical protein